MQRPAESLVDYGSTGNFRAKSPQSCALSNPSEQQGPVSSTVSKPQPAAIAQSDNNPKSAEVKNAFSNSPATQITPRACATLRLGSVRPKFLALCVNTGGVYKTLAEIDTADTCSDSKGFLLMKEAYLKARGLRSKFSFLIKPVTLEFVQVS